MYSDLDCPYCEKGQEVCHDDGEGYAEDETHEMECGDCGKSFVFYTSVMFSYDPHKADCLNDGKHNFEPTCTLPVWATKMKCSMCDMRRNPTPEELKAIESESK